MIAKGGEKLALSVRQNRIWGTLSDGSLTEELTLEGAGNRFADRTDTAAATLLESFKGYYTVAMPAATEGGSASEAVNAAPQGAGYLAMTVGAKGSVKVAGVLADGTKVAHASRLLLSDGGGSEACVPFFVPLYRKTGWAGGLLWFDPETRTVTTDRDSGWFIRWKNPGSGPDGFEMLLDACGGFYGTGAALASAYLFTVEMGIVPYHHAEGASEWAAAPDAVPVPPKGSSLTILQAAKPRKVTEEVRTWYEYDETNPANATLSFTARTGLFKGGFSLCYDYEAGGKLIHKAVSVPYAGVLTPVRAPVFADLPEGMGYALVLDNDPAVKTYKLKRSFPVRLDAAP